MKKYYSILLFLLPILCISQVGIGTISPERELHVDGDDSTIRLEGLNDTNNVLNNSPDLTPVFIDAQGNLTLDDGLNGNASSLLFSDVSNAFVTISVAENNNAPSTTTNIYNQQIVLDADAFVEIKYSLSYNIFNSYNQVTQTGVKILDGKKRQVKTYFTVNGGTMEYGQISQGFFNMHSGGGDGYFYNNGNAYLALPAGTHTLNFYANVGGSVNNTTAVVFGSNDDLLKVRIYQ